MRQALAEATSARKVPERVAPVLGPQVATVRRWLVTDQEVPRKQPHTARRVYQRVLEEEGVVVAESTVRALVAELPWETTDQCLQVKVPQTHAPAQEAEVDFGEFVAVIGGVRMKRWMFILRLSHSVRPCNRPNTLDPDRRLHSLLVSARTGNHNTEAIDDGWSPS